MAEEEVYGESNPSLTYRDERDKVTTDGGLEDISEKPYRSLTATPRDTHLPKEPSEAPRRPAFISCKWPEGSDWAVELSRELEHMGLPVLHDAKHQTKLNDVEGFIKESCCVLMLVTPGFIHALANKPNGNRALKEIKLALQHGKPLLAVIHSSYCGQNPLPALRSMREFTSGSDADGPPPWSSAELATLAGAQSVLVFKGGDGFEGYQRELVRRVRAAVAAAAAGQASAETGPVPTIPRGTVDSAAEERRLREVLRVAGLSKRLPSLLEANIRTPAALEAALRKGRLSTKPHNWSESSLKRVEQVLDSWPVLSTMPDWLRTAPEGLVPLLVPLLAQEEAREFDREGRPRPKRGALPPVTTLDLAGQGPVVMGARGGMAVAALIRDVSGAQTEAARRREEYQQQQPQEQQGAEAGGARSLSLAAMTLYGTATTWLTLTAVDLSDCELGTAVAGEVMGAVATCPTISVLLLAGNGIEDAITSDFATLMRRSGSGALGAGLSTLGLDRNQLTDKGAAALVSVLYDHPGSLTSLDLAGNAGLGPETAEALSRVLQSGLGLRRVRVTNAGMDEASVATLLPALLLSGGRGGGDSSDGSVGVDDLDLSGNAIDVEALTALAAATRQPGYAGGPRRVNLAGANLRVSPSSRRPTLTAETSSHPAGGSGGGSSGGSGTASALASALLLSSNLEELGLGWCGLSGAGLRILVSSLMSRPAGSPAGPQPLSRLAVLDLTGNKLGPEGVSLLGALLPVNLPSLRHLILEECGFGGRELGMLAGMLDVAPWVVDVVQGALKIVLDDTVTGGVRGIWTEPLSDAAAERAKQRQRAHGQGPDGDTAAAEALAGLLRTYLGMSPLLAASEVRRLMLPTPAAASHSFAQPNSFVARKAVASLMAGGPNKLVGLGCLLVHPVVQPVLEALRHTWEALQSEAFEMRMAGGPDNPLTLPLSTPAAQSAFRALDATVVHLRECGDVPGLQSLSLGRNGLAQEAGAPLGAAVALSASVRHLSLRGITQPPVPAPVVGTGAAAVAAATAAAHGGPLAAAAAAARDARALLRLLYPGAATAVESGATTTPLTAPPPASYGGQRMGGPSPGPSRRGTQTEAGREMTTNDGSADPHDTQSGAAGAANGGGSSSQPTSQYAAFLPGLHSLDLTDSGISSHNVAHLADLVRQLPCLEQLVLDFNSLSSPAGATSVTMPTSSGDGTVTTAPDAVSQLFVDLAALPSLSYLSLNYACDGSAMIAVADYLLGLAAASAVPVTSSSMSGVPPPKPPPPSCPNLRVLSLVGCPLDGVVARRLARALVHNTSLSVLRLGGGHPPEGVGPIGSRALAEALTSHHGLVELSLSGVGLTDNAARMLADALPHLLLLCKLDLSYNSLTGYGVEALANAMLARNRSAVGAAAEHKLNVQIHGNRISDELDARMQSLSIPVAMTHAADRMPNVPRYGPPPPPAAGGVSGSTAAALATYGGSGSALLGRGQTAPSSSSGRAVSLPSAPILVPPPTIVRAPVQKHTPSQPVQAKGPRCASSPPRSGPGTASAATMHDPSRPLGSGKTTLLTAVPPPPPPARRSSGKQAPDNVSGGGDSGDYGRWAYTTASKLTKIYGTGDSGEAVGRRGSPPGGGARPSTSPALRTLPMGLGYVRNNSPGAPYAYAVASTSQTNPLLPMNRRRPGGGAGAGTGQSHGALPAVRQSAPVTPATGGEGGGSGSDGDNSTPASPKVYGASEHLTQRIKCHMPDWVKRMQEDYYTKLTSPSRPSTSPSPATPGPPSEHLFRPLLCHDSAWQQNMLQEQHARETAPEPQPKPVPGAPTNDGIVSSVALMQRGAHPTQQRQAPPPQAAPPAQRPQASPRVSEKGAAAAAAVAEDGETAADGAAGEDGAGEQPAPAGGVAALLAGLTGRTGSGNLGSEESMEVVTVRNNGRRKTAIEVMRLKKAKGGDPSQAGTDEGQSHGEDEDGDGEGEGEEGEGEEGEREGEEQAEGQEARAAEGEEGGGGEGEEGGKGRGESAGLAGGEEADGGGYTGAAASGEGTDGSDAAQDAPTAEDEGAVAAESASDKVYGAGEEAGGAAVPENPPQESPAVADGAPGGEYDTYGTADQDPAVAAADESPPDYAPIGDGAPDAGYDAGEPGRAKGAQQEQ